MLCWHLDSILTIYEPSFIDIIFWRRPSAQILLDVVSHILPLYNLSFKETNNNVACWCNLKICKWNESKETCMQSALLKMKEIICNTFWKYFRRTEGMYFLSILLARICGILQNKSTRYVHWIQCVKGNLP